MGIPIAAAYTLSTAGSVFGGWLPLWFIKRGKTVSASRSMSMLIYACCAVPVVLAQWLGNVHVWFAVIIIGFVIGGTSGLECKYLYIGE